MRSPLSFGAIMTAIGHSLGNDGFFRPCTVDAWPGPLWLGVAYTLAASDSRWRSASIISCAQLEPNLILEGSSHWRASESTCEDTSEENYQPFRGKWCAMLIIWLFSPWTLPSTVIIVPNLSWISCLITLQEGVWLLEKKTPRLDKRRPSIFVPSFASAPFTCSYAPSSIQLEFIV